MKISYNWLNELISTGYTPQQTADFLTGCGLEVDGILPYTSIPGALKGIVIGEVKTCEKHPNADRLRVTTVDVGKPELLHIVCGAPNVAAGQKVLVATVGSTVYPMQGEPFEIKKSKIRGEVSEGMICAEDELSMGNSHDGILVLPSDYIAGKPASDYFPVYHDHLIEIGLTANRGDAASHLGVARDLKALSGQAIQLPGSGFKLAVQDATDTVKVVIEDTLGCKRYSGISIRGITVGPSPEWLQQKLKVIGLKPINNIVDITNYVLFELGQPLHAFDLNRIRNKTIRVKKVDAGTRFKTLDQTERILTGTECMICDDEQPLAIGGVFGGLESGIQSDTTAVFVESACFNPASVRKTAKHHGLNTDASFRFERGTDPEMTLTALTRAVQLIQELAGGQVTSEIIDCYPEPLLPVQLEFSLTRCKRLIGQEIPEQDIHNILIALDFTIHSKSADGIWNLSVPTYRTDVTREADVIEEVLRIYGLNRIDIPEQLKSTLVKSPDEAAWLLRNKAADFLASNGFVEMLSNSLTRSAYYSESELTHAVRLLNPLSSDLDIMRLDMVYNGLEMLQYNRNRKITDVKSFEYGYTYQTENGSFKETPHLVLYMTGNKQPQNWNTTESIVDVYSMKSIAEQVLHRLGIKQAQPVYQQAVPKMAHAIQWVADGELIGYMGQVDPQLCASFDLEQPVWMCDFLWNPIRKAQNKKQFRLQLPSPYPAVNRDLALLLDQSVTYEQIHSCVSKIKPEWIREIHAFDVYTGEHITPGKKSYAIRLLLQDENRTLTDFDIDPVMQTVIKRLQQETGAELRS